jgi:capsular exopolysaccharide synthesis family protein
MSTVRTANMRTAGASPRSLLSVPRTAPGGARGRDLDPHLSSLVDPTSFEAEQYRVLRHQLEQLKRSGGLSVLGVTSPAVGDGKTTTAINVAGALAQAPGARVLIVDADLRRPCVGRRLGLADNGGPGLVGALLDSGLEMEVVARHRSPYNLYVLHSGQALEQPYEMLRSPRLGELLDEARRGWDFVVVDTPPVLLVPDCRALEKWVDGFLVVVGAHRTPRKLLGEALSAMDPGKVVGLVFNDDDRPLAGYYKKYRYYSYTRKAGAGRSWR